MLSVVDLDVTYPSGQRAVRGVTFDVPAGQVLALIGGNGAGKSTTMRVAAGVTPPTAGIVTVSGNDVTGTHSADRARRLTGYCPDVAGLPRQLTIRECIGLALATTDSLDRWPAALALAEKFDVARVLDSPTGSFSHGMARRTSALLAVLTARDLLLLDEPFDGVDALGVQVISEAIATAKDAGLAVVVSTHLLDVATTVADRALVMRNGEVVADVLAADLRNGHGRDRYAHLLDGTPAPRPPRRTLRQRLGRALLGADA